jgi:hypothetical protein
MKEVQKIPFAKRRLKIALIAFLTVFFLIFTLDKFIHIQFYASRFSNYPEKAVTYLRAHPFEGNVFSHYNWGGYLIWQYPEKKVFVDGRMPTWRDENAPSGASKNAFKEYQMIVHGQTDLTTFLEKYTISTVLIGANEKRIMPSWLQQKIETALGVKFPDPIAFQEQLQKVGMKVVYKDEVAVIYQKVD